MVITGSSGLIGSALACRLDRRYDVVGFDRPGAPFPPAQIECIDLDVTSDETLPSRGTVMTGYTYLLVAYLLEAAAAVIAALTVRRLTRLDHADRAVAAPGPPPPGSGAAAPWAAPPSGP